MSELWSPKTIQNQVGTGRADRDMDKTGHKKTRGEDGHLRDAVIVKLLKADCRACHAQGRPGDKDRGR